MKRVCLALPLFVLWLVPRASGQVVYHRMNAEWAQVRSAVEADIAYANSLLALDCDAQLAAAMQQRFAVLDQQSLSIANRGLSNPNFVWPTPGPPVALDRRPVVTGMRVRRSGTVRPR
jgi:hypothetical protein